MVLITVCTGNQVEGVSLALLLLLGLAMHLVRVYLIIIAMLLLRYPLIFFVLFILSIPIDLLFLASLILPRHCDHRHLLGSWNCFVCYHSPVYLFALLSFHVGLFWSLRSLSLCCEWYSVSIERLPIVFDTRCQLSRALLYTWLGLRQGDLRTTRKRTKEAFKDLPIDTPTFGLLILHPMC